MQRLFFGKLPPVGDLLHGENAENCGTGRNNLFKKMSPDKELPGDIFVQVLFHACGYKVGFNLGSNSFQYGAHGQVVIHSVADSAAEP